MFDSDTQYSDKFPPIQLYGCSLYFTFNYQVYCKNFQFSSSLMSSLPPFLFLRCIILTICSLFMLSSTLSLIYLFFIGRYGCTLFKGDVFEYWMLMKTVVALTICSLSSSHAVSFLDVLCAKIWLIHVRLVCKNTRADVVLWVNLNKTKTQQLEIQLESCLKAWNLESLFYNTRSQLQFTQIK